MDRILKTDFISKSGAKMQRLSGLNADKRQETLKSKTQSMIFIPEVHQSKMKDIKTINKQSVMGALIHDYDEGGQMGQG